MSEEKKGSLKDRSADIFMGTMAAMNEARKLENARQFAKSARAELPPESSIGLRNAIQGLAEACFGKPWNEIKDMKIPMSEDLALKMRRVTKDIQDGLRAKGIDPREYYDEDQIIEN